MSQGQTDEAKQGTGPSGDSLIDFLLVLPFLLFLHLILLLLFFRLSYFLCSPSSFLSSSFPLWVLPLPVTLHSNSLLIVFILICSLLFLVSAPLVFLSSASAISSAYTASFIETKAALSICVYPGSRAEGKALWITLMEWMNK